MSYMNVTEVESALIALSAAHPSICELITLPHNTVEGRTTHAVRLGTQPANTVDCYYLTGGVHAREWGSCEILVNLATDLCDAYAGSTGLGYGGKYFSAAEVKALTEQINIIIYPCVNPDGRNFSQTSVGLWRKNRNTADSGGDPSRIGIDINRNQDFLWNFTSAFAPGAINTFLASANPADDTYHGSSPTGEFETQNIKFIHDTYTRIRWYVDVHSFSEDILFVWGDDEMQVTDPSKNFRNAAFDGQRGLIGDAYSEYIPDGDLSELQALASAFTTSLAEVRGKVYAAKPGFSLYPTAGTNDDYAYSRHFVDSSKSKSLSFTVEWGTEFQPPWSEMQNIILDVTSGLIGLGLEAIGVDSFIVSNRDTFSSYEVETTNSFDEAIYVVYDGFAPNSLGVPGATPSVVFRADTIGGPVIPSMTATSTAVALENPGAPTTPQRITFTFRVEFANTSAFTVETRDIFAQVTFAGIQDVAQMRLINQPNPYMLDGPITWLSTDVRVFQLRPGQKVNASSSVTLGNPDTDGNAPYTYVQSLLTELRGFGNNPAPPFENISTDESASALELSRTVGGVRVLNFAVAKVRYRANTVDAVDVRVFFRTFNTMVSDLRYNMTPGADLQNYRRSLSGTIPLLGINQFFSGAGNQIVSIPYFAEGRVNTATQSMTAQTDNTNKQTLVHAGSQEAHQYFGCWLDFNQTDPQFPVNVPAGSDGPFASRVPIPQIIRGIHQCMVAEIRYQPGAVDPIPNGATPSSSDRLAQRNLAIVESDNPGTSATHVVQHTVLLKPSQTAIVAGAAALASSAATTGERPMFDELVIRWNDLPGDTAATVYLPDWRAQEVVDLASQRAPSHGLSVVDDNTVSCRVGGITYIPIPGRVQQPLPGLMTLELPLTVKEGERFRIDVQQQSGPVFTRIARGPVEGAANVGLGDFSFSARKVLGAFRLTTLVKLGEPLLAKAVRNLAALRYIYTAIPSGDSWKPVFDRYIAQLAGQVGGLGVDPSQVPPSLDDPGIPGQPAPEALECVTGKICQIYFNCFGEFEGFTLEGCVSSRRFRSCEPGIAELALRACKDRLWLTVCVDRKRPDRIREIIVRSTPCGC
jgi:murein tripeptide amidase MpaA